MFTTNVPLACTASHVRPELARHTRITGGSRAHCLHLVANAHDLHQRALDQLSYEPARDDLGGLTPTLFEQVNHSGPTTSAAIGEPDS